MKIKLVAPPLYVMVTTSLEKEAGIELLNKAIETAKIEITKRKGNLTVKVAPRITSDREDRMLANMISEMDQEQQVPSATAVVRCRSCIEMPFSGGQRRKRRRLG